MKKLWLVPLILSALVYTAACGDPDDRLALPEMPRQPENPDDENNNTSMKMKITIGDRAITATMEDNAAARDFLSRLPLSVTLEDYNNIAEKIFYPSPVLTVKGVARGCAPAPGDITIYAPWGNVAIFCKSWPQSRDLIRIGRIDGNGVEVLAVPGNLSVKLEKQ